MHQLREWQLFLLLQIRLSLLHNEMQGVREVIFHRIILLIDGVAASPSFKGREPADHLSDTLFHVDLAFALTNKGPIITGSRSDNRSSCLLSPARSHLLARVWCQERMLLQIGIDLGQQFLLF